VAADRAHLDRDAVQQAAEHRGQGLEAALARAAGGRAKHEAVSVAEEVRLSMSRRRALLSLSVPDIADVLRKFLLEHSATGEAVQVRSGDVAYVRAALLRDRDLAAVLCRLQGAGSHGGDSGQEFWMTRVDRFLGRLHARETERKGPRRVCD
jgi:hypothetical protein